MTMPDNPYATPKSTGQADEMPARVTMPMRWFFMVMFSLAAFFQIKIGATAIKAGYFPDEATLRVHPDPRDVYWLALRYVLPWCVVMGLVGVHAVWNLARRRWSRAVFWSGLLAALFSWVSFGILNVVLVTLWMLKRPGRPGESEVRLEAETVESIGVEEAMRILKVEAMNRFGIRENQFGASLARGLRIAPGEVSGFINDLEVDYGVSLEDEVDPSRASVQDMIEVLARRKGDGLTGGREIGGSW